MKQILFFLILCFGGFSLLFSQEQDIQVIDRQTNNPVSFAKIIDGNANGVITDIDGKANITIQATEKYTFRFFMYKDTVVKGADLLKMTRVYLSPDAQVLDEVEIRPGENPAHRIIQHVMDNQKVNDPLRNNSFEYNSYSKLYFTGELEESVSRDTITDSSTIRALEFLDKQYIFLTETKAKRTFNPPNYDKEVITAYNVSGIKEPMFATFLNQFQSFSFYDNNFTLGNSEYINPIAPGGLRRYLFILEDTIFHHGTSDTTYTISFRPRKGKNFEGLKGYLYINTKNWAIEKVIASPYSSKEDNSGFEVKVIQEYKFTNGLKWFPEKISTEFNFGNAISINGMDGIGRGSMYISDVQFDGVSKKGFNPVSVQVAPTALADSTKLAEVRGNTATGKEEKTYQVIDSVAQENNFQRLYNILKIASTGKIPIKVVSLPIDRIIRYNDQEGFRFGLGVETNMMLSRIFQVGGYFAYGIRDKQWKWGGDLSFTFEQSRLVQLKLHYSDDLRERGGTDLYDNSFNLLSADSYREFFLNKMDRERYAGISVGAYIKQNIRVQIFGNYKRFSFVDNYRYNPLFTNGGTNDKFDIAEVGTVINWNIRERVMILDDQRVSLGTKWPKITFEFAKGIKGLALANYDYYRFQLNITQDFKIRGFGNLSLTTQNGMTLGNVPLTLSQVLQGTGRNYTLSVPNTFQTMVPAEFFSDRFTSLFMQFSFLPIKNKTKWTEPLFVIQSAAGLGDMKNRTDHTGFDFKTPDKGFYESGLTIDNLLKSNFVGLGIGVFYRYGPYASIYEKNNFFYKFTIRFSLFGN
ncbi:MAG: hypothetical protein H3C31_03590 [Brumimicrobium sp.]|nr:hypothetical protein [Brumimicrobium sp.]